MRIIDADTLKEAIKTDIYVVDYGVEGAIYGMFWSGIEYEIDKQPTVEQLDEISNAYENGYQQGKFEGRQTGKWIDTEFMKLKECSICHARWGIYSIEEFDFCPTCGAKMEGQDE